MIKDIICWWSGGVTSAVACNMANDLFPNQCRFIFIDTKNEDDDTYRFMKDCQELYDSEIETISSDSYSGVKECWYKHLSLNVATGAICSYKLKRVVREKWEKKNKFRHQVFGFDINESKRAISIKANHSQTNPIFPLMMYGLEKTDCIEMIESYGIEVPKMYQLGFQNNNCFKTGCVQGGIGYWQKIKREYPEKFNNMAKIEHELSDIKKEPVTMLKDQSNSAKEKNNQKVFLKKHPDYPNTKCIDDMKGREPKPLFECNGFCGTNDFTPNETQKELF